jgi:hypothetical protein
MRGHALVAPPGISEKARSKIYPDFHSGAFFVLGNAARAR